jgi:hypothetical protein
LMRPFRCLDTVVTETPAACATLRIVDAVGFFIVAFANLPHVDNSSIGTEVCKPLY